jgi:hypothetical protein
VPELDQRDEEVLVPQLRVGERLNVRRRMGRVEDAERLHPKRESSPRPERRLQYTSDRTAPKRPPIPRFLIRTLFGAHNRLFDPDVRDASNGPFIAVREHIRALGYEVETLDDQPLRADDRVIFFDASSLRTHDGPLDVYLRIKGWLTRRRLRRDAYADCRRAGILERCALMLWEGPAIQPRNWSPALHERFSTILTWNDACVDGRRFHKFCWPQTPDFPEMASVPFEKRKLLVNISMNKSSRHPRELYSARRTAIRYFERACPGHFDLYGIGWDRVAEGGLSPNPTVPYTSYRGPVPNKWEVLPLYRFALAYENLRDEPGYITEKIFDVMRAGCVPVYWGAPNVADFVDRDAFVDRRDFSSDEELAAYLAGTSEQEFQRRQAAIREYLDSPRFARFLPPAFAATLATTMRL